MELKGIGGTMIIDGTANDDYLVGIDSDDELNGFGGNDILDGGFGADDMDGGDGDDQFVVDNAGDVIRELLGGGNDVVFASVSYTLNAGAYVEVLSTSQHDATDAINLTGNDLASRLIGNYGANILDGGGGADELIGLFGNDVYRVYSQDDHVIEDAGAGNDIVYASGSFALAAGQEVETLSTDVHLATTAINLAGNAFHNTLIGNYGANVLDGGGGGDAMYGLAGDDIYVVDSAQDQVIEAFGEGSDRIQASISYALTADQYVETLSTDQAGTAAIVLIGNQLNNRLEGNAGDNVLNGGSGADIMIGFAGDDTYVIDDAGDVVIDGVGQGNDLVLTYLSHTLSNGNQIETLSTVFHQGTTAIDLGGNDYDNTLIGNYGANVLNGNGGADVMIGLNGNDTYVADNAGDVVQEAAGGGNDVLLSFVSYTLAAGQEVETISTAVQGGTAAINLAGNEIVQTIIGNAGANIIDGGGGSDVLFGLGGADGFAFTTALGVGNIDMLADFSVVDDQILLSAAIFTGMSPGALSASAFVVGAAALDADDRIVYNSATAALFYDADGNGAGAAVRFAFVVPGVSLTASDFVVFGSAPNSPPVAVDDQKQTDKTDAAPATGNVLANDSDPDGNSLTVVAVQGSSSNVGQSVTGVYGSLTINANGSYTYVVNPADPDTQALYFTESDTEVFTYQIGDGNGATASATLSILVTGGKTLTDPDNLQGGEGYDTLSLDADTMITTASLFRGYEAFILNTRRDEDNVDGHTYSFILDNDNAPNNGSVMTFDGH
ncbi:MAG TPA: Ig-like domain-containing protein, partial [Allosphingosinicella sp.]|nr:Ig-like domain-containing protein [Allosphingosinicella sp.]